MKKNILDNIRVELDPPRYAYGWSQQLETQAKDLEAWAKDLMVFLRDHRSQDDVPIKVIRDRRDICTHCGSDWETDDDCIPLCCSKAVEEHEAEAIAKQQSENLAKVKGE